MIRVGKHIAGLGLMAALAAGSVIGMGRAEAAPLPALAKAPVIETSTGVQTVAARRGRVVVRRGGPVRIVRVHRPRTVIIRRSRPVARSVVVVGNRCGYYRSRWQVTGNPVWRRRLDLCLAGVR